MEPTIFINSKILNSYSYYIEDYYINYCMKVDSKNPVFIIFNFNFYHRFLDHLNLLNQIQNLQIKIFVMHLVVI